MQKYLLVAAIGLMATSAVAADPDRNPVQVGVYATLNFGAPNLKSLSPTYALRLDHGLDYGSTHQLRLPAIIQFNFSHVNGIDSASFYGMPLNMQSYRQLNLIGDGASVLAWTTFAVVGVGVVYGATDAVHENNKRQTPTTEPEPEEQKEIKK